MPVSRAGYVRLLALCALAVALAGCGASAEQKDVEAALGKAAAVERLTYSGSVEMVSSGAAVGTPNEKTQITFTGAADDSNPAAPQTLLDMTVQNTSVRAVAPGDGNTYVVTQAGTFGAPLDAATADRGDAGIGGVLKSLIPVLDDFKTGNDDETRDGQPLRTISAKAAAAEVCEQVAPAFSGYMDAASSNVSSVKNLTGDAPLEEVCSKLLIEDPTLWFGIDSTGMLRMIAMEAQLTLLGMGELKMTLRFDVTAFGEPVTIAKPAGATMLGSQAELQRRSALPSGG